MGEGDNMRFAMTIHKTIRYDAHLCMTSYGTETGWTPEKVAEGLKAGKLFIAGSQVMDNNARPVAGILEMQPEYSGFTYEGNLE
jgi:hypothetical protein